MSASIREAKQYGISLGIETIDVDALLCHVLKKSRTYLYTWPEKTLAEPDWHQLQHLMKQRQAGQPIAYLTGMREFWSLPIQTNSTTLIPRPDTEVLVESLLARAKQLDAKCVDLGTGTGAIALAIKSERPSWQMKGIDRISDAVLLAQSNARALELDVIFEQGNWCDGIEDESVDVIVSNPPYIDENDVHLSQGDVRFEPRSALVAEDTGLSDIRVIIQQASRCLKKGGSIFLEHGWQQAPQVRGLLEDSEFERIETVQDYGGNERVTLGFKP